MRVEPDDGKTVVASRQPLNGAHMRAAAAAQDDRSLRERRREREVLLGERLLVDDGRLRIRQPEGRGLDHCVAARAPGARNPDESRRERAPAGVTLILAGLERDRGQRVAVRTLRPKSRHQDPGYREAGLRRDDAVEHLRKLGEIGELGRSREVARLAEAVDPDGRNVELPRRRDVVEEAGCDVDVAPGRRIKPVGEDLPVAVRRLVRADLARDDRPVEGNTDGLHGGGEEVLIRVRERHESPPSRPELGEGPGDLREDRPRGQRLGKGVRLGFRELQALALGEQDERLVQDFAVGQRAFELDSRLDLVVAL